MKLKMHISFLLSFLILAANMGFALNVHYCKGEISQVSIAYKLHEPCSSHPVNSHHGKKDSKKCCGTADGTHKNCCKNELVKLKDKADNPVLVKSLQLELSGFYAVNEWKPLHFFVPQQNVRQESPAYYCDSHAPPLFKLYCKYILYA